MSCRRKGERIDEGKKSFAEITPSFGLAVVSRVETIVVEIGESVAKKAAKGRRKRVN